MTWIETYSGKAFDLRNPTPDMVDVTDIAHALARINRFTGHTGSPYSVAEHALHVCARVMGLYPKDALLHALALHHDDGEYVTGDISAPMKWLLREMQRERYGYDRESDLGIIEANAQCAILTALGLPHPTPEQKMIIKAADLYLLKIERWSLLPNTGKHAWGTHEGKPDGWAEHRINDALWRQTTPESMADRFLRRSDSLLAALRSKTG